MLRSSMGSVWSSGVGTYNLELDPMGKLLYGLLVKDSCALVLDCRVVPVADDVRPLIVVNVTVVGCERQGMMTYLLDMPVGVTMIPKGDHVTNEGRRVSTIRITEFDDASVDKGTSDDILLFARTDTLKDDARLFLDVVLVVIPRKKVVVRFGQK